MAITKTRSPTLPASLSLYIICNHKNISQLKTLIIPIPTTVTIESPQIQKIIANAIESIIVDRILAIDNYTQFQLDILSDR